MEHHYLLAIDGGSQSTKVTIFDPRGGVAAAASVPLRPLHLAEPGIVEHPGDDLWDSLVCACRETLERFNGDPNEILAIGLCSIRYCRCLLQKDGRLAAPVINWMDERVARPYEHTNAATAYVVSANGYLTKRLTGENLDTVANYQGQWPIDTDAWEWSREDAVFAHYNLPRSMLFDLVMPGEITGGLVPEAAEALGLPAGLPVVATANDKAVEALGSGLVGPGKALISLGTYICGMVDGKDNPKDSQSFWTNFAGMPRRYLHESGGIRRGMWLISWFKDLLGDEAEKRGREMGADAIAYLNRLAAEVPAGSEGLLTVPEWLARPDKPYQRGIMLGFDGRHQAGHIFRSLMEAIAMTMKNRMDAMCAELNLPLREIIISGGGSNSDVFMQIFADVFGIPAIRNRVNGAASLGAAICAAKAVGVYQTFAEAANLMVEKERDFLPIAANREIYASVNAEVYRNLTDSTDPLLAKTNAIFSQKSSP